MLTSRLALACALSVLALQAGAAQQPATPASPRPRFGTSTAAVLVDVVVRDKKGHPIDGLTQGDFEVLEDGVPQRIFSCDSMSSRPEGPVPAGSPPGGPVPGAPVPAGPPPEGPQSGQTVVALVFDWLSEQPRVESFKAARTLVDDLKPGEYAGVFSVDHSLHRLVPFTRDTVALSAGFEQALTRPRPGSSRQSGAMTNALVSRAEIAPTAGAEEAGVPSGAVPGSTPPPEPTGPGGDSVGASSRANAQFAAMLQQFDEMDRYADKEQQANAVSDALRGLVQMLAPLPGRKTVVLFSEGLSVTNATVDRWGRLEDEANRHNVSFYTFDALGLRVQSQQAAMGRVIRPEDGTSFSRGLYGDGMERRTEVLLNGPTQGLAELASSTGGLYVNNTNNLTGAFARVNEDRRSYYMLAYSSTNPRLDGSYRTITVKVRRPGATVRARRGYVASPSIERIERRDYEAPAVAALSESPMPLAFPFRLQAFSTPMPGQPGIASLVAAVDAKVLTFARDDASARYQGQATIVARILGPTGEVIATQSQHYDLNGDLAHLEAAKDARILFFSAPDLPAGTHRVEWVVRDDQGGHASVARSTLHVPDGVKPVVGDVIVVSHTERAPKGNTADRNPLSWKGLLLYPSFGDTVSRSHDHELSFAVPMLVDPHGPTPKGELKLLAGGKTVAELPFELGAPAKDGRLVALGRIPVAPLPPGGYDLEVTITAGDRREVRSAEFAVVK